MIRQLKFKFKRKWRDISVFRRPLGTGPAGDDKISVVLYFDYEREFGHKEASVSSGRGFHSVISILDEYSLKANWNCVGKLSEVWPETIDSIISKGHEISSHTYAHIVPLMVNDSALYKDIKHFKNEFEKKYNIGIQGFHSPTDAWSKILIKILLENKFTYDLALEPNEKNHNVCFISPYLTNRFEIGNAILRIPSVSDDWKMFTGEMNPEEMLGHWKSYLSEKYFGKTIGIGFHPWVIGRNEKNINAFRQLMAKINTSAFLKTYTGSEIVNWYQETM